MNQIALTRAAWAHSDQLSEAQAFIRQRGGTIRTFCFWSSAQYAGTAIALAIEPAPRGPG